MARPHLKSSKVPPPRGEEKTSLEIEPYPPDCFGSKVSGLRYSTKTKHKSRPTLSIFSTWENFRTEDCAKDSGEEFFTEMYCVRITNLKDSIGIRLKNAVHLGKKFLAAIFSAIVYYETV